MRKAVVVLIITALSLSMLAFVAGCGGDANKDEAKSLMISGDTYMDAVKLKTEELQDMQAELGSTAIGGDASALTGEAGKAMQAEVEAILEDIDSNLAAAKAEYEKILALDGVQDYKDYAAKMIEAIDAYKEQLGYTRTLVGMLIEGLTEMAAAGNVDLTALMAIMDSEEYKKIEELGTLGDELVDEAEKIQLDKKLKD